MSLTSKLRSGIVKDWFGVRFPNTQRFCTGANRELRDGATTVPCAIPRPQGSDASLVGQAVGYVLTAHLQETALDVSFAVTNVAILNRLWKNLQVDATEVARRAVQRIHKLKLTHLMGSADWNELCRLALVLGRLEQGGRNVSQVGASVAQELARSKGDLDAFIGTFATPATVTDLSALGRVAVDDCIELRKARPLHIGPTFAQSQALGGADADIICDGQLIDFKSSAQSKVVGRRDAWQLVGYLLADTPDLYHIRKAGFAALRRRRTVLWGAQELLDELSGRPAPGIADLRAEFHDLLELAARGDKDLSQLQFREPAANLDKTHRALRHSHGAATCRDLAVFGVATRALQHSGLHAVASLGCCNFAAAQVPGGGQSMRRSPPRGWVVRGLRISCGVGVAVRAG